MRVVAAFAFWAFLVLSVGLGQAAEKSVVEIVTKTGVHSFSVGPHSAWNTGVKADRSPCASAFINPSSCGASVDTTPAYRVTRLSRHCPGGS